MSEERIDKMSANGIDEQLAVRKFSRRSNPAIELQNHLSSLSLSQFTEREGE